MSYSEYISSLQLCFSCDNTDGHPNHTLAELYSRRESYPECLFRFSYTRFVVFVFCGLGLRSLDGDRWETVHSCVAVAVLGLRRLDGDRWETVHSCVAVAVRSLLL